MGEKVDCGYWGIDKNECSERNCCWSETSLVDGPIPWCYHCDDAGAPVGGQKRYEMDPISQGPGPESEHHDEGGAPSEGLGGGDQKDEDECEEGQGEGQIHEEPKEPLRPAPTIESGCHLDRQMLLASLKEVQSYMQTEAENQTDPEFLAKLNSMVEVLNADMNNLKAYCERAQSQLETIRSPMKDLTDKIFRKIPTAESGEPPERSTNLEELELELQQKTLHNHLAKINDELLKMSKIAVETETAVVDANRACVEAMEVAKQVQDQLEAKRQQELEEQERLAELARLEEEKRKAEELERLEQERKEQELIRQREREANQWPWHTFEMTPQADFDGGICCVCRADPMYFLPGEQLTVEYVELAESDFEYLDNEELVGHIIRLKADDVTTLKAPLTVLMPHCMSRQSMSSREPVIKAEVEPGHWEEMGKTFDTTMDGIKDVHFAQSEVKLITKLAVVSRFKRDQLKFKKKGGKTASKVDPRVSFTTKRETFAGRKKKKVPTATLR